MKIFAFTFKLGKFTKNTSIASKSMELANQLFDEKYAKVRKKIEIISTTSHEVPEYSPEQEPSEDRKKFTDNYLVNLATIYKMGMVVRINLCKNLQ